VKAQAGCHERCRDCDNEMPLMTSRIHLISLDAPRYMGTHVDTLSLDTPLASLVTTGLHLISLDTFRYKVCTHIESDDTSCFSRHA